MTFSIRVVVCVILASGIRLCLAAPPLSEALSTSSSNEDANVTPCSKEQYAAKFGALPTYSLLTSTFRPSLQNGFVKAQITYLSQCPGGGSSFTASIQKKANMEIVLMSRSEPNCAGAVRLPEAAAFSEMVSVPLPAEAGEERKYLAFPPESDYELWLLTEPHQGSNFASEDNTPEEQSPTLAAKPAAWNDAEDGEWAPPGLDIAAVS